MSKPETKTEAAGPKPGQFVQESTERFVPASESRFMASSEYGSPETSYIPESGTPAEHLLRPEYWASIKALRTNVRIWVTAEDGAYVGMLLVQKAAQGYAIVCWLPGYPFVPPSVGANLAVADGYDIQHRGLIVKWRIVRLKDGHVLKQGLDTEDEARAWLRDHKRLLNN